MWPVDTGVGEVTGAPSSVTVSPLPSGVYTTSSSWTDQVPGTPSTCSGSSPVSQSWLTMDIHP
ncbi:MAG: hypothetical protein ACTMIB_01455 [Cellulosimicrobium funkei]